MVASPPARTDADEVPERPIECRLVGEAGLQRDLDERMSARQHQTLRDLDPTLDQPSMRRNAEGRSERAREIADRHPALPGEHVEAHAAVEPGSQDLGGPAGLPRCQTARHDLGQACQPAVGLQQVRPE